MKKMLILGFLFYMKNKRYINRLYFPEPRRELYTCLCMRNVIESHSKSALMLEVTGNYRSKRNKSPETWRFFSAEAQIGGKPHV